MSNGARNSEDKVYLGNELTPPPLGVRVTQLKCDPTGDNNNIALQRFCENTQHTMELVDLKTVNYYLVLKGIFFNLIAIRYNRL